MSRWNFPRRIHSFSRRVLEPILVGVLLHALAFADKPLWWTQRGVIDTGKAANDYAPLNQGQLKNLITQAVLELDATLDGGAGAPLHDMVEAWSHAGSGTNDFSPVNIGQLKFAAKPVYDRLIEVGYTASYPWVGALQAPNDFALANVGQAKQLFSFATANVSSDGVPDWWKLTYFGNTAVDVSSDAAGTGLTLLQKYHLGLDPTKVSTAMDGLSDAWKIEHGYDPKSRLSTIGDGIPDTWKLQYGFSTTVPMADEDPDGDGLSNYAEFILGTDPTKKDTDGDGIPDNLDPHPTVFDPHSVSTYIVVPDQEAWENNAGIEQEDIDYGRIDVRWITPDTQITGFIVERKISNGDWATVTPQPIASDQRQFEDHGLLAGQNYYYRVRAVNRQGTIQAESEPVGASYRIPVVTGLFARNSTFIFDKPGTPEFTDPPPDVPKVYLTSNWTWNQTYSYTPPPSPPGYSVENDGGSASATVTVDPKQHFRQFDSTHAYWSNSNSSDGTTSFTNAGGSLDTYHSEYQGYTTTAPEGRSSLSDANLQLSDKRTQHHENWADDSSSGGYDYNVKTEEDSAYQFQRQLAASQHPLWLGDTYTEDDPADTAFSVFSSVTVEVPGGASTVDSQTTLGDDGHWSGTSTSSSRGRTSTIVLTKPAWDEEGVFPGVDTPWDSITATAPDLRTYSFYSNDGEGSIDQVTATLHLSGEYTTGEFRKDCAHDMPDWPVEFSFSGATWNYETMAFTSERLDGVTASTNLAPTEDSLFVSKLQYELRTNASVPGAYVWYEVFVPDDDPSTQIDESLKTRVIGTHRVTVSEVRSTGPSFEIDPATFPQDLRGTYRLVLPPSFAGGNDFGDDLDPAEKAAGGLTLDAIPPADSSASTGSTSLYGATFTLNNSGIPGATYALNWGSDAIAVTLTYTDPITNEQVTKDIAKGEPLPGEWLAAAQMPLFFMQVDSTKMGASPLALSVSATDGTGNSIGDDAITAHFLPELMVDANHDGDMSFTDSSTHDRDVTSPGQPYRFWINNDHDGEDDDVVGPPDWHNTAILQKRDLEDFTRIWINFRGLTALVRTPGVEVRLEWKPLDDSTTWADTDHPTIQLFQAVEPDGGRKYVEDDKWATQQLGAPYNQEYGQVNRDIGPFSLVLSPAMLTNLTEDHPSLYLLFEGVSAGKGQLLVSLIQNAQKIAVSPPLYLEICDVKNMYERWTVDPSAVVPSAGADPAIRAEISTRALPSAQVPQYAGFTYTDQSPEEKKYLVYVHGWNMAPAEKDTFAETAYKRLWWQGYKGRFAAFQWPTSWGINKQFDALMHPTAYDRGEEIAWNSAAPFSRLLAQFNFVCPQQVYVMGHSMGNVVSGEGLRLYARRGGVVSGYAACEAAIEAESYDPSTTVSFPLTFDQKVAGIMRHLDSHTPDIHANWLAPNLTGVAREINFYNENDFALAVGVWELDQAFKPDQSGDPQFVVSGGRFYVSYGDGIDVPLIVGDQNDSKDNYTIFSYASEARSEALGRIPTPLANGQFAIAESLRDLWERDPNAKDYQDRKWHSGQFQFTNMIVQRFWSQLLVDFKLK